MSFYTLPEMFLIKTMHSFLFALFASKDSSLSARNIFLTKNMWEQVPITFSPSTRGEMLLLAFFFIIFAKVEVLDLSIETVSNAMNVLGRWEVTQFFNGL